MRGWPAYDWPLATKCVWTNHQRSIMGAKGKVVWLCQLGSPRPAGAVHCTVIVLPCHNTPACTWHKQCNVNQDLDLDSTRTQSYIALCMTFKSWSRSRLECTATALAP